MMCDSTLNLLLAAGLGFDLQTWIIIIVAIATSLGGLLQKTKQKEPAPRGEERQPPPRPARGPERRVLPPSRPRTPSDRPVARRVEPAAPPTRQVHVTPVAPAVATAPPAASQVEAPSLAPGRREPPLAAAPPSAGPAAVQRLLQRLPPLQAAIVLSELLAPPLATREQEPLR